MGTMCVELRSNDQLLHNLNSNFEIETLPPFE
jgi:hypothetical protein